MEFEKESKDEKQQEPLVPIDLIFWTVGSNRRPKGIPVRMPRETEIHNRMLAEEMLQKVETSPIFDEMGENPEFRAFFLKKMYNRYFKNGYNKLNFIFPRDQENHILQLGEGLGKKSTTEVQ